MTNSILPAVDTFLKNKNKSLFINGTFQSIESATTFEVINPATETVIASVPIADEKVVDTAVKAAHNALENGAWPKLLLNQSQDDYVELVSDKKSKTPCTKPYINAIYQETLNQGAIVRTSGNKIIISPPLTIQKEEVDVVVDALEQAFEKVSL